ncbi:MAG: radical SAM protein [Candidatus Cloacimonetes bacterium]|nr:radical SAM protein [Candidatus Cloacimonadota bacterium]MCF7814572.1 radical SAM protein [Candidatus Cloacimonadota bacterium]MCF7867762.1 radical SAM protein [Candidatus Cloacimonadota bacterium]MCF7883260.1 radical SAM protein [Candidatus Cloacimonadota bacterium]
MPINYTVSALYSCNSRCKTCNIWKKEARNLTLSEYKQIFKKIGRSPYWITISGGEPFLRKDIDELCAIIYKYSKPAIINIPSNGLLTDVIVNKVNKIAETCKKTQIIINLSIDGIGKQHDEIRQIPGNYEKVINTFEKLKALKQGNVQVGIHTVISKFNVKEFRNIAQKLMHLKPDSYITEIAEERIELDTMNSDITPNILSYRSAIDYLIHIIKNGEFKGMAKITQAFRIEYYNLVKRILRDKTQVIPCYSGIASVQISPDGEVWSCCIKAKSLGNLRDHDYKFKRIWFSPLADKERKSIKNKECYCPLANSSYTNMLMDIPTLFRVFFRSFIKWW